MLALEVKRNIHVEIKCSIIKLWSSHAICTWKFQSFFYYGKKRITSPGLEYLPRRQILHLLLKSLGRSILSAILKLVQSYVSLIGRMLWMLPFNSISCHSDLMPINLSLFCFSYAASSLFAFTCRGKACCWFMCSAW